MNTVKVSQEVINTLYNFLKENEGRKMEIGMHCYSFCFDNTIENWTVIMDEWELTIENNGQNYKFINDDGYEGFVTDANLMNVYPEVGVLEIQTEHCGVAFMFI